METRTYTVYKFDELPEESKQKAIEKYRENEDLPWMTNDMKERLMELLDENNIKAGADRIKCYYSLSHCQGDGFQFVGHMSWGKYKIEIKSNGRYCNSYCTEFEILDTSKEDWPDVCGNGKNVYTKFKKLYHSICKQMEDYGYKYIEDQLSDKTITGTLIANDYDFKLDGSID